MKRACRLALLTLLLGCAARADDIRSATQSYVLHVPAKVSLESGEIPPETSTVPAPTSDRTPMEAAFRLSGTGAAGITAQFEVQPATSDAIADAFTGTISLRVTGDDGSHWSLEVDGKPRESGATGNTIQVSSRSAGSATLVVSHDGGQGHWEIVATIISND